MSLPPLRGLPWERQANGAEQGLRPLEVRGAPITKQVGQLISATWTVRNTGGTGGYAEMLMVWIGPNRVVGRSPVQPVGPGQDLALSLSWDTTGWNPAEYGMSIEIASVTFIGTRIQVLGYDTFVVNVIRNPYQFS